jgi:hypothetical protein
MLSSFPGLGFETLNIYSEQLKPPPRAAVIKDRTTPLQAGRIFQLLGKSYLKSPALSRGNVYPFDSGLVMSFKGT